MPGTLVTDSLASNLLAGATLNSATSSNGTAVDLQYPCNFGVQVVTGTVTGTSPTLDITIQASSTSDFSSDVVDLGAFPTIGDEDNVTKHAVFYTPKRYVRASVVTGGTSPVFTGTTAKAVEPHLLRTVSTTA